MNTKNAKSKTLMQFIRFVSVGVMNTAVTLFVIFLCKSVLNINPYVSNVAGYVAGLINSFLWNRAWVFGKKNDKMRHQALKFVIGFGVCYLLQLAVIWLMMQTSLKEREYVVFTFTLSGYGVATIIGNIVYTIANFAYNKFVTFRERTEKTNKQGTKIYV